MTGGLREQFDTILEEVLEALPAELTKLLEEVPLVVEDRPGDQDLAHLNLAGGEFLCGLYTGIPLTRRSVQHSGVMPDVIKIFREGIFRAAAGRRGPVSQAALRRQIRMTVLHEIGHHFGLGEEDLRRYGYG